MPSKEIEEELAAVNRTAGSDDEEEESEEEREEGGESEAKVGCVGSLFSLAHRLKWGEMLIA